MSEARWARRDRYFIAWGDYTVAACRVGGVWRFRAFHQGRPLGAPVDSWDAGQVMAENHAQSRGSNATDSTVPAALEG